MTCCSKFPRTVLYTCILIICSTVVKAQLQVSFAFDSTAFIPGKTAAVNIILYNNTERSNTYQLSVTCPFTIINKAPAEVTLQAGARILLPLNIYIPRRAKSDSVYSLRCTAMSNTTTTSVETVASFSLHEERNVTMNCLNPQLYLFDDNNTAMIDIRCSNLGNSTQPLRIEVSDPMNDRTRVNTHFWLPGFTDTILHIPYTLAASVLKSSSGHRQLKVSGLYSDNEAFSTFFIDVFVVGNHKSLPVAENLSAYSMQSDMVGIYAKYLGSTYHYYEGIANGNIPVGSGRRLHYNADVLYYPAFASHNMVLMNSYVDYTSKETGIRAGTVYEMLEMNLSGRGVVLRNGQDAATHFRAGYVNGNYNIAGSFKDISYSSSDAVFATYGKRLDRTKVMDLQFIQYWDAQAQVASTLTGGEVQFKIPSGRHEFTVASYINYNSSKPYSARPISNWGTAGSFSYSGQVQRWQFESFNYVSTRTYAGFQKGALNMNERVMYAFGNSLQWWAGYNRRTSDPRYLITRFNFQNSRYHIETIETGFSTSIHQKIYATVKPYYYKEFNQFFFTGAANGVLLRSTRLNVAASWNGRDNHNISFSVDMGKSFSSVKHFRSFYSWKTNFNYQYKTFSMNAVFQNAPFYAGELSLASLNGNRFRQIVFSPSYYAFLFQKKLSFNISDYFSYDNAGMQWTNNLLVKTTLNLPHGFLLDASFNTMRYAFSGKTNTFNAGVVKKIGRTANANNGQLEIFLYRDDNSNDQYDKGEQPAAHVLVRINDDIFQTGNDGKLSYKNIPNGNYTASVVQGNGYYANDQPIFVGGKTKLGIPLHKMATLTGRIVMQKSEHSYATNESAEGIRIIVTDDKGKRYNAYANPGGDFIMYLPENSYNLQLDIESLQDKYLCAEPSKAVTLLTSAPATITFDITIKEREIKVKKFSSTN